MSSTIWQHLAIINFVHLSQVLQTDLPVEQADSRLQAIQQGFLKTLLQYFISSLFPVKNQKQ